MSYAGIRIVHEFFAMYDFMVLQREDVLLVSNALPPDSAGPPDAFILDREMVGRLRNAIVRPVPWHTMSFTPSVLKNSPEIFHFLRPSFIGRVKPFFPDTGFSRVLVLPGLPASENLRTAAVDFLKEKGIDHVVRYPTVISGLIEKVNPRQVYLSEANEIFRILKYYRFFPEKEPTLPFKH